MNLKNDKISDLVKPSDFKITTKTDIIERLVEKLNDELQDILRNNADETEEIYTDTILHIDIECEEGDISLKKDVYQSVIDIFKNQVGWKNVTYLFINETEDDYPFHRFSFYFGDGDDNKHEDSFKITL